MSGGHIPRRYRKKPVVIEAVQFDPTVRPWPACIVPWTNDKPVPRDMSWGYIKTLEGDHHVIAGDWIIKGTDGEFYPCKAHIFPGIYEAVDE